MCVLTCLCLYDKKGINTTKGDPLTEYQRRVGFFLSFIMMVHPDQDNPKLNYRSITCRESVKMMTEDCKGYGRSVRDTFRQDTNRGTSRPILQSDSKSKASHGPRKWDKWRSVNIRPYAEESTQIIYYEGRPAYVYWVIPGAVLEGLTYLLVTLRHYSHLLRADLFYCVWHNTREKRSRLDWDVKYPMTWSSPRPYMGMNCSLLPQNNTNLTLPFFWW